ncbi:MAG: class I SAM-dependent methyltransferase [Ktedonobacteraceae bacterium]
MSQQSENPTSAQNGHTAHRFFAKQYERVSRSEKEQSFMNPLRQEVTSQAQGLVLEIGAGNGLNFAFYDPVTVERVEATEPDSVMLGYARERAAKARVPVNLTQTPVENLPFADESFDSVVVTLVFCSVNDPLRGLSEVRRVLKPGGALLMVEHVRAHGAIAAAMQNIITPVTKLVAGNCHWNRDTEKTVKAAGFQIEQRRDAGGFVLPFVVLHAVK